MGGIDLTAETLILMLRLGILLVLYLFLWQLVAVVWRDLRRPTSDEQPARPAGKLVVVDGGGTSFPPGHSFPIFGEATLGRGTTNSIVLADGFVSTNHARLAYRGGAWWLADLRSRNGTSVNGQGIDGEVQIREGDVLAIGQVTLKLAK